MSAAVSSSDPGAIARDGNCIPNVVMRSAFKTAANNLNVCHINGGVYTQRSIDFDEFLRTQRPILS